MTTDITAATSPGSPAGARGTLLALVAALALVLSVLVPAPGLAQPDTPETIISFTVDDGTVSQTVGADILTAHRMRGTFYVSSGSIGTPGYLTHRDLRRISDAGHEIGGHTVHHPDLSTIRPNEVRRQICQDRANLMGWGYRVTSFAFPHGWSSPSAQDAAEACGYNSARIVGDLHSPRACLDCTSTESVPPAKPFAIRALSMVDVTWTLDELKQIVLHAESTGGGWVPLVLHQTCDYCGNLSISPVVLDQFADWLAGREAGGTVVRTVDQVMGGSVQPPRHGPPDESASEISNPSLELGGPGPHPRGWEPTGWGNTDAVWTRVRDAHSGQWAARVDVAERTAGDAKLMPALDLGSYAPPAKPGKRYAVSTWYKSSAPTELALYYRDQTGTWRYWASSSSFPATDEWQQATWTSPPAPPGTTGLSFGLALFSAGSLTTDDYSMRVAPDPTVCERLELWRPLRWMCG